MRSGGVAAARRANARAVGGIAPRVNRAGRVAQPMSARPSSPRDTRAALHCAARRDIVLRGARERGAGAVAMLSREENEMTERGVLDIVTPTAASDGAGVRLKRSIATESLDHLDPFFLFDHFGSENPDDYVAGFPMHPHRGIETITYMLDGSVAHRDSIG